jgi:hypothetical protein
VGHRLSTDFRIALLCADNKLAESVDEGVAGLGAPDVHRADSFGHLIDDIDGAGCPVVVLLSLADLCADGLDAINLVDMQLSMMDGVITVLIVEPWVAAELDSVMLMTTFEDRVPSSDLTKLGPVLERLFPGLKLNAPPPPPPPRSSHAVRDVSTTRSVVRDIHGLSGGRLEDLWLPRILYSLYVRKFTGDLSLVTPQRELSVKIVDGEAGDLETGDRRKLLAAFAWTSGRFEITPGQPSKTTFRTYGSTLELIYDGCLEFVSINQTAERLAGYDDYFPVCTEFIGTRKTLLERRDTLHKFCQSCDGTRSWSQVISATWHDVREVLKAAIYALETDLIVMRPARQKERAQVRYTTRSTAGIAPKEISASRSTADPVEAEKIVSRLEARLEHFDRMDAYSLFGLKPGCGLKVVRTQFYKMVKQHHPDVYGGNMSADIQGMAELVFVHIKDAYVELVNLERDTVEAEDMQSSPSERVVSKIRSKDAASRTAKKAREAHGGSSGPASRSNAGSRPSASTSRPSRSTRPSPSSRPSRPSRSSRPTATASRRVPAPSGSRSTSRPVPSPPGRTSAGKPDEASPPRDPSIRRTRQRPIPKPVKPESLTQEGTPAVVFEPPPGPARRARPLRGKSGRSGQTVQAPALRPQKETEERPAVGANASRTPRRKQTGEQKDRMSTKLPPDRHFKNGSRFLQAKSYEKAKEAFRHAVTGDEQNPVYRAHYAWARYLAAPEDFTKCLQMLQECVELDGRSVEAHLFMGRIAKREGQGNRALKSFRAVLADDPKNIEASREMRLYQMRAGKPEPSESDGKKAGSKDDGNFFGKLFNRKKDT